MATVVEIDLERTYVPPPPPPRRSRRLHLGAWRWVLVGVMVVLVALMGAAVWAMRYDRSSSRLLLPGTSIGGVPVGGMTSAQATEVLRDRLEAPLHAGITVGAERFRATTTPWELGRRLDVAAAVKRAAQASHEGNLVARVWRRMFGDEQRAFPLAPKWGSGQLGALTTQAARAVFVAPQNARLDTSSGFVSIVPDKKGLALDVEQSKRKLSRAAELGESRVDLVTRPTEPEVKASAFAQVILIRTGENKLYLYNDGRIAKTYDVATGKADYPTPTGVWRIVSKLKDPTWINPNSSWSKSMPAKIPPGPNNPLGTHALALNAPGILIHATPDVASIGFSASHGCIRMRPQDEIDLFSQVSTGTPVAIVAAGPPKPRKPVQLPPAANPNEAVSVQY